MIQSNKKGASGKRSKRNDTKLRELTSLELKSHVPWGNESSDRPVRTGFLRNGHRIRSISLVCGYECYGDTGWLRVYDFDLWREKKKAGPRTHGGDRPRNRGKGKIHDWPRTHGGDRPRNRGKGKIHDWPRTHGGDRPRNRGKGKIHGFPRIRGKLRSLDELMWFCSWEMNQWIFEVRQESKKQIFNQIAYIIAIPRDMLQKDHKNDFRWMGKIIIL